MIENNTYVDTQKLKVLILSDRLLERAKELSDYLCLAGIHVVGLVENKEQALKMADVVIDFLIIAGYLKNLQSYEVIKELTKRQKAFKTVHWAMLDELIIYYCNQFKIPLMFERMQPMSDFVDYLQENRPSGMDIPDEVIPAIRDVSEPTKQTLIGRLKKYLWNW